MGSMKRRGLLRGLGAGALGLLGGRYARAGAQSGQQIAEPGVSEKGLALRDFEPRSMLESASTRIASARFPVIDTHVHLSMTARSDQGVAVGEEVELRAKPEPLLTMMGIKNVQAMVNLTGGTGQGLDRVLQTFDHAHPDRFFTTTEPCYDLFEDPHYPQLQADTIEKAHRAGAKGLKILKTLGLYLREQTTSGPLVRVDDERFDPMWEACGAHAMPVFIHVADPAAFFLPTGRFNERYDELIEHPDWSFHGKDFPPREELLAARNRVIERHPKTRFVGLHVGNNPEDLGHVASCLDRFPNLWVDIAARIAELGRQPRTAARFFDRYQDRILFGTDELPSGPETASQRFAETYETYFRFLESEDEYFPYSAARIPPQGRWRIYGLGLSDQILRKVYHQNAERLLNLPRRS